jgi:hypothetical protein
MGRQHLILRIDAGLKQSPWTSIRGDLYRPKEEA